MVLYARNDIQTHLGPNGHRHARPIKGDGTPVPIWGIDCPPCELLLQGHPAWAPSRYKIPLTPDEQDDLEDAKAAAEAALHQQQMALAQQALIAQMAAKNAQPDIDPEDVQVTSETTNPVPADPASSGPEVAASDLAVLSKADLKDLCRDRGLPVSGTTQDLINRLVGTN